jgi:hypothetical protein
MAADDWMAAPVKKSHFFVPGGWSRATQHEKLTNMPTPTAAVRRYADKTLMMEAKE